MISNKFFLISLISIIIVALFLFFFFSPEERIYTNIECSNCSNEPSNCSTNNECQNIIISKCTCPKIAQPVCGVDGKTYGNPCHAECADIKVAHEDKCKYQGFCYGDPKVCPDGSTVMMVAPNCEYLKCPSETTCGNGVCESGENAEWEYTPTSSRNTNENYCQSDCDPS